MRGLVAIGNDTTGITPGGGDRAAVVRSLNDWLRQNFTGGRVVITAGLAALAPEVLADVLTAVRGFDSFDPDNDPYREHDLGTLTVGDTGVVWKIDSYDRDLHWASPDPADPAVTVRVLTIMLAEDA